jgi:hypothetical protein
VPTAFERELERLGLKPDELAHSAALRDWAEMNVLTSFVPTELIRAWKLREMPDEV